MRSVVAAAIVIAAACVLAPAFAEAAAGKPSGGAAQDPQQAPPPPPPPPADVAVPRAAQPRGPERARASRGGGERAPASRAGSADPSTGSGSPRATSRGERAPAREEAGRESRGETRGAVRAPRPRDVEEARAPFDSADLAQGRPSPTPMNASTSSASDDEQRRAERRGSVRRPPATGAGTGDRAIPRSQAPPPPASRGRVVRNYPYYPNYSYYDPWGYGSFGLGYLYYSPWNWVPYGYGYPRYGGTFGFDVGSVKIKVKPRDAEVWVDGYYAGSVDDFDGMFQALRLDSGAYRIEIRKPGFESLRFDVRVQPERTITFRGELRPVP